MGVDEIKSQGFSLKELFRDVSYQVDYYQRDYTWGEEEVRTLLRDLCTSFAYWSNDPALIRRPGNAPQYFLGDHAEDRRQIDANLNVWVRQNAKCLVPRQATFALFTTSRRRSSAACLFRQMM